MPFDDSFKRWTGIGASEMWKAYCWDENLYYSKLGARQGKEYVRPFKGNLATRLGHESEDITLAVGAELAGLTLLEHDGKTKRHPEHDWIFSTADAMAHDKDGEICTVEAKLVGFGPSLEWGHPSDGHEAVPNKVRAQVETQMAVENTETGHILAWIGTEIRHYRIERDRDWANKLFERARTFWDWIESESGFPIGHTDATKRYLARKYAESSNVIRTDEQAKELLIQRDKHHEVIQERTTERDLLDNQLRALIGADDGVEVPDVGRATYLFDRRGRRVLRIKMYEENNE